jgi:hypothetical protein
LNNGLIATLRDRPYLDKHAKRPVKTIRSRHSLPAVFVDEKLGGQAIQNIAPDLPSKFGKHNNVGRDCEYNKTC